MFSCLWRITRRAAQSLNLCAMIEFTANASTKIGNMLQNRKCKNVTRRERIGWSVPVHGV